MTYVLSPLLQMQLHAHLLSMAREQDPSFWTTLPVGALSLDLWTVLTMELVFTTVPTQKMPVPPAVFNVHVSKTPNSGYFITTKRRHYYNNFM